MTTLEFSSMVTRESHPLKNYAYQLTRNLDDADDLLQETMLKAFTYREKFVDATNLKGWLYTIMKNSFINNYRRLAKRNALIDQTDNTYVLDSPLHTTSNLGEAKFLAKDIEKAINQIPADLRKTFLLNHEGYKYHEIADMLHIPIGTVKTRIFIARRLLRQKLRTHGMELGYPAE